MHPSYMKSRFAANRTADVGAGQLLKQFLDYYGNKFDVQEHGVSMLPGMSVFNKRAHDMFRVRNPTHLSVYDPVIPSCDAGCRFSNSSLLRRVLRDALVLFENRSAVYERNMALAQKGDKPYTPQGILFKVLQSRRYRELFDRQREYARHFQRRFRNRGSPRWMHFLTSLKSETMFKDCAIFDEFLHRCSLGSGSDWYLASPPDAACTAIKSLVRSSQGK